MTSSSAYSAIANEAIVHRHAELLSRQPYPHLFVTLSGSHLYGFSSPNSDWDLRGVHVTPARRLLGLDSQPETCEDQNAAGGLVLDELVTHDARKYFRLLLKNNGYVLEQIFSPIVVDDAMGRLAELRVIAKSCITSQHSQHYKGFGYGEWTKFVNNPTKTVKRILYVFRVLLSGIHLMRTGEVEANIIRLNEWAKLPYIPDLIEEKRSGDETATLAAGHGLAFYTREYERLINRLVEAASASTLPPAPLPGARDALNALLIDLRLPSGTGYSDRRS